MRRPLFRFLRRPTVRCPPIRLGGSGGISFSERVAHSRASTGTVGSILPVGGRPPVPRVRARFRRRWRDSSARFRRRATVRVLEAAGYQPQLTDKQQCCGLTWISTGQLTAAKKIVGRTLDALSEHAEAGIPIVGMEPSCTGVLRSDTIELLGTAAATPVAENTHTLAELLAERGWEPPSLEGTTVVAQPHCHHHAVMGWSPDAQLLEKAGARVQRLGGCCGLAGNFGVEKGHYDVSVAVAEQQLLPAVRAADPDTTILADGYSCRTQLADLAEVRGQHLAELLAGHLEPR
nr:(Fe-S)-binding protein [Rhodococcus marinonascens]